VKVRVNVGHVGMVVPGRREWFVLLHISWGIIGALAPDKVVVLGVSIHDPRRQTLKRYPGGSCSVFWMMRSAAQLSLELQVTVIMMDEVTSCRC
jgi:hypothetical protein